MWGLEQGDGGIGWKEWFALVWHVVGTQETNHHRTKSVLCTISEHP